MTKRSRARRHVRSGFKQNEKGGRRGAAWTFPTRNGPDDGSLTWDAVVFRDDGCQDGFLYPLVLLLLLRPCLFFLTAPPHPSPLPKAARTKRKKNVFQMNSGRDVSPGDGWLILVQLLIIKSHSSQAEGVLPNPNYPGKKHT